MKIRINKVDALFSRYIRERDEWTCQRCYKQYEPPTSALHCSHFWARRRQNTRFDPDNCIALCFGCHRLWESEKHGVYREFMLQRLGQKGFDDLAVRAEMHKKKTHAEADALLWLKQTK